MAQANSAKKGSSATSKTNESPSLEFRMQTSRFLNELEMWRDNVKILESVVADDDECIEAWYLLAFALFKLKKYATSEECCMNVRNVIVKLKIVDPELEEATREIYDELCKHKAKTTKPQEVPAGEDDDEEWGTDSEEDIDDEEDETMQDS